MTRRAREIRESMARREIELREMMAARRAREVRESMVREMMAARRERDERMARRERGEATPESMALASYLGERLNNTLFGEKPTDDFLDTASTFRIAPWDNLLNGERNGDPPASSMTPEQKNYLENFRNWSEQLPRRGEEEKPAEEAQTLVQKPEAGGKPAEGEGCGGEETQTSS